MNIWQKNELFVHIDNVTPIELKTLNRILRSDQVTDTRIANRISEIILRILNVQAIRRTK